MQKLELKIPPVAVFIAMFVVIAKVAQLFPTLRFPLPFGFTVFAICFVCAGYVGITGIIAFKRAKTTVHPQKPHETSQMVVKGIYSITRNPMYLGLFLLLFGFAYWQQNLLSILLSFGFVLYMNRFQIEPEERALEQRFGQAFIDYKQSVRRWI